MSFQLTDKVRKATANDSVLRSLTKFLRDSGAIMRIRCCSKRILVTSGLVREASQPALSTAANRKLCATPTRAVECSTSPTYWEPSPVERFQTFTTREDHWPGSFRRRPPVPRSRFITEVSVE